jgi:inhibitor of the pro-sigma K processing machinery
MDFNIITYLACICFLFIFGRVFIVPITKILKLVINSVLGGGLIYLINLVGGGIGFHIGLNFFTSILVRNFRYTRSYLYCDNKIVNSIKRKI